MIGLTTVCADTAVKSQKSVYEMSVRRQEAVCDFQQRIIEQTHRTVRRQCGARASRRRRCYALARRGMNRKTHTYLIAEKPPTGCMLRVHCNGTSGRLRPLREQQDSFRRGCRNVIWAVEGSQRVVDLHAAMPSRIGPRCGCDPELERVDENLDPIDNRISLV